MKLEFSVEANIVNHKWPTAKQSVKMLLRLKENLSDKSGGRGQPWTRLVTFVAE